MGHSRCGGGIRCAGSILCAACPLEAVAVCRVRRSRGGAVVSAWWAAGALNASKALDGRAASGLEFVVQGDPSINDDVYSYTCEARADGKNLAAVRLSCDLELKVGAHARVIGRVSRFENDAYGRSRVLRGEVRKVQKPFGLCRSTSALRAAASAAKWAACVHRACDRPGACAHSRCHLRSFGRAAPQPAGDWFSVTGTAHLIAVSGSHLAIVGFVIEGVLQKDSVLTWSSPGDIGDNAYGLRCLYRRVSSAVRACCMVFATLVVNGASVAGTAHRHSS